MIDKKTILITCLALLIISCCFLPIKTTAQFFADNTRQIGESCSENADCISGDCEDSDLDIENDDFCVCDDIPGPLNPYPSFSTDCANKYGTKPGETWLCQDGVAASHDLHYCFSNQSGNYFPVSDEQIIQAVEEQETKQAAEISYENIVGKAPILPALGSFCNLKDINKNEPNPWIAQCIVGLYKYFVVFGSMLAVLAIMIGAIMMMSSGVKADYVKTGKTIILSAIFGIVLLLGSYLLLKIINPNLINLPAITIEGIEMAELDIEKGIAEHASITSSNQATLAAAVSIPTNVATCDTSPSQPSGIGNTTYLGQLDCHSNRERELTDIVNIVLHDTGGSTQATVNYWISQYKKGIKPYIASHYAIERDGTIYQLLDEKKVGIHAGAFNKSSIGIDLVSNVPTIYHYYNIDECLIKCRDGKYENCADKESAIAKCTPYFTDAQYASLNSLINSIASRTSVTVDDNHIHSHCEIAHGDPRNFDWKRIGLDPAPHKNATSYSTNACFFFPDFTTRVQKEANKVF